VENFIYKDKLEDIPLAIQSFEDYLQRFKSYESAVDAIYHAYMLKLKLGENDDAERLRLMLVERFPESKYAQMLTNKDFLNTKQQMFAEQDSLYQMTYEAFNKSDYPAVFKQVEDVQKRYPMNSLMPKFLFLNALSVGKSKSKDEFETALTQLVETLPYSTQPSSSGSNYRYCDFFCFRYYL
jgi:TolA-binding protein